MKLAVSLVLLCLIGPCYAASTQELEKAIGEIDKQLDAFLASECTTARKQLCAVMQGFHTGTAPKKTAFSRSFLVSRLYSVQANMKRTLDYPDTSALLVVSQAAADVAVRFEKISIESPAEKDEIEAAMNSIAQGQKPKEGPFTAFVAGVAREGQFAKCEIARDTYICRNESANHDVVMLREQKGSIYALVPAMVPFLPKSFDTVPGFLLAEFTFGQK